MFETKFRAQTKEMLESHQALQSELQSKCKRFEEENRKLKEQALIVKREAEVDIQAAEKAAEFTKR
mgnify:CR=1 FL=1